MDGMVRATFRLALLGSAKLIGFRFQYVIVIAAEVTAIVQLFNFQFDPQYLEYVGYPDPTLEWSFGQHTSPVVWIGVSLIYILSLNMLPVRAYGEIEYVFGCCKIVFLVMLILFNVIINAHSITSHDNPSPFKNYDSPYSFESKNFTVHDKVVTGGPGHLASIWTAMTVAVFGMSGFDAVAITAAESRDLERDESIKIATRKISLRIILLYSLAIFAVGLNVPYTDPNLRGYATDSIKSGEHSVFIIAAVRAHLRGWPHFLNAFFIFSAASSGVNALFMSSRILHALALTPGAWPRWSIATTVKTKLGRTVWGVPMAAAFASWLVSLVSFLVVSPYPETVSIPTQHCLWGHEY
jgi:amino acid permease